MDCCCFINLTIVFLFGGLFGFAELLQRYSETKYLFKVWQSYFYIILNGAISISALLIIHYLKVPDEIFKFTSIEFGNIIIAGFGGMLIIRSSFFSYKKNEQKIDVGFAAVFQIFLDTAEDRMKQKAAAKKLKTFYSIMKDVNFDSAKSVLPILCKSFIYNYSDGDIEGLSKEITIIGNDAGLSNSQKSMLLGNLVSLYYNEELLQAAVDIIKADDKISKSENSIEHWIKTLNS